MLNAMGLKYAADQELMQAHDQTCEERKKEDGDDTAAPFTRDPGTYEGCLAGPTSEKARAPGGSRGDARGNSSKAC